jgi:GNAT superfamily N-acetyltransferase
MDIDVYPATAERWDDLERLFGPRGACGGCWCMWWRQTTREYDAGKGLANKEALQQLVKAGREPGLLAYIDGEPAGWCALAPRLVYTRLAASRVFAPVDDRPVWSIVCFFVAKRFRRQGVTHALLSAAVAYAKEHGAVIVEAYPVEPKQRQTPDVYAYPGLASTFRAAGFVEVARRSQTRPIMRYTL